MRLLIIEDEKDLALPLKKMLEIHGFAVDYAPDGEQGFATAKLNAYDCLLLDLNLPGIDGLELADKLRRVGQNVPIIMLTARSQIYNKLDGFKNGADDYITKPFDLDELIARINAVIKRDSVNKQDKLKFKDFELLPMQNMVICYQGNKIINKIILNTKETAVLEYLIRHSNRIISTEELLEHVWDSEVNMFTDTVKTHIKTLRQKIDPDKKIIQTIRNKGYKIDL
ncbi:MAG: response regulator transcription factor [Patescibacteria group bacterium]